MSWTVILEDEHKNAISLLHDELYISSSCRLENFNLLKYLDPYGDAVFNHLQMDDLIQDLNILKSVDDNPLINEIQMLADRCKSEPHTYLAFYGD